MYNVKHLLKNNESVQNLRQIESSLASFCNLCACAYYYLSNFSGGVGGQLLIMTNRKVQCMFCPFR